MNQMAPILEPVVDVSNDPTISVTGNRAATSLRPRFRARPEFPEQSAIADILDFAGWYLRQWWQQGRDHEWLLGLRFALVNVFAFALLVAAWAAGYVDMVWIADTSGLSAAIAAVFVLGLAFGCRAAVAISRDLNRVRRHDGEFPREPVDNLKERLRGRIAVVRHTANTLVFLGLIGTVIGFIVALSGVKPGEAGDASAIAPMVSTLIHGMSIALYTTLVGSVFALWLTVLHRILATGASKLLCAARAAGYA
jgi:hypothetical protein